MFQVDQGQSAKVPVRMVYTSGEDATGISYTSASVYVQKAGGSSTVKILQVSEWTEVDAYGMPGVYDLALSDTDLNTPGIFKYVVGAANCAKFFGAVSVRIKPPSETQVVSIDSKLGTPTNSNFAADIAAVASSTTAIKTHTDYIPSDLAVKLDRALGLLRENSKLDNTSFDSNGNLTSGRYRIFASSTDAEAGSNAIATYDVTATWIGNNIQNYLMVKRP
jgi:hypothetical protein